MRRGAKKGWEMRNMRLIALVAVLMVLVVACGGKSAEEELLEQIIESSGEDIGDVDVNTDGDGNVSIQMEGEDGETISITGDDNGDGDVNVVVEGDDGEQMTITGDDDEMTVTVEGEDGGSMTVGGGDIPEGFTLPVLDGGEVLMSMVMEGAGSVHLAYPGGSYDQLVAFYDDALTLGEDGYRGENSWTDDSGTHRSTSWIGDTFIVDVSDCPLESEATDGVCVTLSQFEE